MSRGDNRHRRTRREAFVLRRDDPHASTRRLGPRQPSRCPGCGLVMSFREEDEQGACNDCSGGAFVADPDP